VAAVQYTFTNNQYTEQHKANNTQNNIEQQKSKQYTELHKNYFGRVRAVPRLCELYPGISLTTEEKHGETSVKVAEECQLAR